MKIWLSLLLILAFIIPAQAVEDTQYIAVYTSPNLKHCWRGIGHKIDKLWSTESFDDIDEFLVSVKKEAKGKAIIVDFAVHGSPRDGLLAKYKDDKNSPVFFASAGTVVNHVEKALTGCKVILIIEACHGSHCYRSTIRGNFPVHSKMYYIENHTAAVGFPVYGGHYGSNLCTELFEEYMHSLQGRKPIFLRDLRLSMTETDPPNNECLPLQSSYLDFLRKLDN